MVVREEDVLFKARPMVKKKSMERNWADIINKNGHSTFHTGKPENFNN